VSDLLLSLSKKVPGPRRIYFNKRQSSTRTGVLVKEPDDSLALSDSFLARRFSVGLNRREIVIPVHHRSHGTDTGDRI
jgi:hypothetical protein